MRCVDQGSNKHLGAFAIYLKPWNSDIFEFIDLQLIFRCGGPTDSKAEANAVTPLMLSWCHAFTYAYLYFAPTLFVRLGRL